MKQDGCYNIHIDRLRLSGEFASGVKMLKGHEVLRTKNKTTVSLNNLSC